MRMHRDNSLHRDSLCAGTVAANQGRSLISWSAERRSAWGVGLTENGAHQGKGIIDAAAFLHFGDDRVALGANMLRDIIFG